MDFANMCCDWWLGLWLRLECSLDSLSIDSAHVIYVAEGHNVGASKAVSI